MQTSKTFGWRAYRLALDGQVGYELFSTAFSELADAATAAQASGEAGQYVILPVVTITETVDNDETQG